MANIELGQLSLYSLKIFFGIFVKDSDTADFLKNIYTKKHNFFFGVHAK